MLVPVGEKSDFNGTSFKHRLQIDLFPFLTSLRESFKNHVDKTWPFSDLPPTYLCGHFYVLNVDKKWTIWTTFTTNIFTVLCNVVGFVTLPIVV